VPPSTPPFAVLIRARDDGFSLVEIVVATAILAVALVAVVELFVAATRANGAARDATRATLLALDKVEQLRATDFAATADEQRDFPLGGRYIRRWAADPLPSHEDDALVLRVVVTDLAGVPAGGAVTVRARPSR
jgi:type II secretion system protein I